MLILRSLKGRTGIKEIKGELNEGSDYQVLAREVKTKQYQRRDLSMSEARTTALVLRLGLRLALMKALTPMSSW